MYDEEDFLMLSGIQHFAFCRRQWALIHIEQQWAENYFTVDGEIMHENVHNPDFHEKRGDTIITRAMAVSSSRLGLSGECDAVELKRSENGVNISGLEGKYILTPVEYKRGKPKDDICDIVQLVAQALCLEDMLCCRIDYGYLYYSEIKRRVRVNFDDDIRKRTEEMIAEMHKMYQSKHTPLVKRKKACGTCSLKNLCLPVICGKSASEYINNILSKEESE